MSIDPNLAETRYFREGDGYVSVGVEPFADNPLTFCDPLGTFLTWGSRFISPSENPYRDPRDFMIQTVGEARELDCETMQDALYALNVAGYAAAGIYRFEHGGVSYELGGSNPFGDRWDSCPVGFAFVPPEKLAAEGIDRETAIARMRGEMREYSCWANGEVYLSTEYDAQGEETSSRIYYGLNGFEGEHPGIEPIDLGPGETLREYAQDALMASELRSAWTFRGADKSFPRDAYVNYPFAIVADEGRRSWRIVDARISSVSFTAFERPQEALRQLNGYLGNAKDAIEAFIPPKTVLDRPIDDLVKEAKGRSAEKNATLDHPHREPPAPELGR